MSRLCLFVYLSEGIMTITQGLGEKKPEREQKKGRRRWWSSCWKSEGGSCFRHPQK
ncbi:hypothetical protein DAPPUDRAFT_299868 [Daphnia pulex]|uniref:Uncharacterized protein n=1 Tax=Daphnia pulex TaxID=6669 RepID=E9FQP2_DAPPU|nr:hypothetical protein DAPPUDRAFT_299868 [Daphnia pulex]|eukprot:EFX90021.1 hypothetical protein DAPPUDRAFT_299868 [Daphnia pulex]